MNISLSRCQKYFTAVGTAPSRRLNHDRLFVGVQSFGAPKERPDLLNHF
jgi:hypothetical protein